MYKKYEVCIRETLSEKLEKIKDNHHYPLIVATQETLINGYYTPYTGMNLFLLNAYCRDMQLRERMFCTYKQRDEFGKKVLRNEKGVLIMMANGDFNHVFPCPYTKYVSDSHIKLIDEKRRELKFKFVQQVRYGGKFPVNEEGIGRMIYDKLYNSLLIKDALNKLTTEIAASIVAARIGISKSIEVQNIKLLEQWNEIIKKENLKWNPFIKSINEKVALNILDAEKVKLDVDYYKKDLDRTIKELAINKEQNRIYKLEELMTPKIRI